MSTSLDSPPAERDQSAAIRDVYERDYARRPSGHLPGRLMPRRFTDTVEG